MPENISIQTTAEVNIQLEAAITSAGELEIRYAGQPQDRYTINCLNTLNSRLHVAHFDDLGGVRWLVSAGPGTRTSGEPWGQTANGISDEGPDPDTVGTNGSLVEVEVYADPPAGSSALRKKKVIHIEIKPEIPQPEDLGFG